MADDAKSGEEHIGQIYDGDQGRYQIREILGSGGMGVVCLGTVVGSDRKVAVKFLHRELSDESSSSRERFRREIKVLQDLKAFRGIVQIEDLGTTPAGEMFLVMEYVTAQPLNELIADNPNGISQIRAIQIVIEILLVLEPIHRRKFLHRDLKPHNICVYEDPLGIRLLDFGLSKPYQEGEGYAKVTKRKGGKAAEIPGSPHYMAEEQFLRPKDVDERTDLYAVGIVLYEMIAGVPPFRGIYLQDILKQHRDKEPAPIEQTIDGGPISYRLQNVLEKALAKKPASRYQNAGEFKEDLYDVLNMLNKARQPKKSLDHKYRIIRKIGSGGNSEVFEAEHLVDNSMIALKITREGSSDWDEETLINEADRALNHDNIVKVIEFGVFDSRPALAMELVPGGTVEDLVDQYADAGIPEGVFYRIIIDVCRGLHHAHQSNIVHRDVKPANMLRTLDGRIKIADFGIAKRFDADEEEGDTGAKNTVLAKGTAPYISPEQCDLEGRVDRRADIYSLGCVMYEMLSGHLPFRDGILIMQHLQSDPPPLKVKGEFKNPDELARVVEKAMKKRKDERFQSMKELAQEIVRISKLKPQKKTHKALVIDTGADAFLDEKGEVGGTSRTTTADVGRVNTGVPLKKLLLFGIPTAAALVVALVFALKGGDEPPKKDDTNQETAEVDKDLLEQRAQYDAATNLLDEGDFEGLADLDLEKMRSDPTRVQLVLDDLKANLTAKVFSEVESPENASALFDVAEKAQKAWENVAPDDEGAAKIGPFVNAGREFLQIENADALGVRDFDQTRAQELSQAATALAEEITSARRANVWDEFSATVERKLALANGEALASYIANSKTEALDAALISRLQSFFSASLDAKTAAPVRAKIFQGLKDRFVRTAPKGQPDALAAFVTREMMPFLELDGVSSDELYAQVTSRSRPDGDDLAVASLAEVGASALVAVHNSQEFLSAIDAKLGDQPESWQEGINNLAASGLPLKVYRPLLRSRLEGLMKSDAFQKGIGARLSSAAKPKVLAAALDKEVRAVERILGSGRVLTDAMRPQVSSFLISDVEEAWGELQPRLGTWKNADGTAKSASDLNDVLESMALFVESFPDDKAKVQRVRGEAEDIFRALKFNGRWLSLLYVARVHGALVRDPESSVQTAIQEYSALLPEADLMLEENYRRGLADEDGLNLAWSEEERACIELKMAFPDLELDLIRERRVEIGGPYAFTQADQGHYVVRIAPKSMDGGFVNTSRDQIVRVEVPLDLRVDGVDKQDPIRVAYESKARRKFDIRPPVIAKPVPNGAGFLVTVADNAPAPDGGFVPTVIFEGQKLQPENRADGKFYRLDLDDFSRVAGAPTLSIRARDAAGNETQLTLDPASLSTIKTFCVNDRAQKLDAQFQADIDVFGTQALSAAALSQLDSRLIEADGKIRALKQHDAVKATEVASRVVANVDSKLRRWILLAAKESELESVEKAFMKVLDSQKVLVAQNGLATSEVVKGLFDGKLSSLKNAGSKPTVSNGNTGNTGTTGNTSGINSGNGGTSRTVPDGGRNTTRTPRSSYNQGSVTVPGLPGVTFIHLKVNGRDVWMADREVSLGLAKSVSPGIARAARAQSDIISKRKVRWRLDDQQPIAPLSVGMAKGLVRDFNQKFKSAAGTACKGPVSFVIPNVEEWRKAGQSQTGRRSGLGWKNMSAIPAEYIFRTSIKHPNYYEKLKPVGGDSYSGGKFHFLSGNVSEIVETRRRFYVVGGSVDISGAPNAMDSFDISGNIESGAQVTERKGKALSGLRLAIRASNR